MMVTLSVGPKNSKKKKGNFIAQNLTSTVLTKHPCASSGSANGMTHVYLFFSPLTKGVALYRVHSRSPPSASRANPCMCRLDPLLRSFLTYANYVRFTHEICASTNVQKTKPDQTQRNLKYVFGVCLRQLDIAPCFQVLLPWHEIASKQS